MIKICVESRAIGSWKRLVPVSNKEPIIPPRPLIETWVGVVTE